MESRGFDINDVPIPPPELRQKSWWTKFKEKVSKNIDRDWRSFPIYLFALCLVLIMALLVRVYVDVQDLKWELKLSDQEMVADEYFRGVAGTGSMHPLIDKDTYSGMVTRNRELDEDERLWMKRIYIYKREDSPGNYSHVIHRLVGIWNITEPGVYYVFKGDANDVVDQPVLREQVYEEMVGIKYD